MLNKNMGVFMAKRKTRISGTGMKGADGIPYCIQTEVSWQIDIESIKMRVERYLSEAAESGKYSIAGLCIALNVPRAVLGLWREGYVCAADTRDPGVVPNKTLAVCIEMALLHLQRYWEECDKPSTMNLKQLEATGALGDGNVSAATPPFDLGRLKKYAQ